MAIARAVLEYCADPRKLGAKTMFATHYHELSALEGTIPGVRNYNISAKRQNGKLLFLRKILPGAADESYGIEVAKLAGVPESVIRAADAHLKELNAQGRGGECGGSGKAGERSGESRRRRRGRRGREAARRRSQHALPPLEAPGCSLNSKTISDDRRNGQRRKRDEKKGEKVLLVLGALLIAAGVFVGVTLGWDYSPDNYAYNDIAFTSADTETGECSFVSVQLQRS